MTPITVIWNPSSNSAARAEAMLVELNLWPDVRIEQLEDQSSIREVIQELGDDAGLVVAAGGDGTASSTVNAMMQVGCQATLGILPLGTGNDLARSLGIPFDSGRGAGRPSERNREAHGLAGVRIKRESQVVC